MKEEAKSFLDGNDHSASGAAAEPVLRGREQHISELAIHGFSNEDISQITGYSSYIVVSSLKKIFNMNGVGDRANLLLKHYGPIGEERLATVAAAYSLTSTETKVLGYVLDAMMLPDIRARLATEGISPAKPHLESLKSKLGTSYQFTLFWIAHRGELPDTPPQKNHAEDDIPASCAFYDRLAPRQRPITGLLLNGWDNKEICRKAGISDSVLRDHLKQVYNKSGTSNKFELARQYFGPPGTQRIDALTARYGLTQKQADVLAEILEGKEQQNIATALGLSSDTVKTHIENIIRKCGVRKRIELFMVAHDDTAEGWIDTQIMDGPR